MNRNWILLELDLAVRQYILDKGALRPLHQQIEQCQNPWLDTE